MVIYFVFFAIFIFSLTAISNLLGLVCDPVRGLVEYPCQDRNAIGVAAAVSSSQLALAGVAGCLYAGIPISRPKSPATTAEMMTAIIR